MGVRAHWQGSAYGYLIIRLSCLYRFSFRFFFNFVFTAGDRNFCLGLSLSFDINHLFLLQQVIHHLVELFFLHLIQHNIAQGLSLNFNWLTLLFFLLWYWFYNFGCLKFLSAICYTDVRNGNIEIILASFNKSWVLVKVQDLLNFAIHFTVILGDWEFKHSLISRKVKEFILFYKVIKLFILLQNYFHSFIALTTFMLWILWISTLVELWAWHTVW